MAKKKSVWNTNFAENAKIRGRVHDHFVKKIKTIRDDRFDLEEKWMEYFRMWNVQKDGNHGYNGRANLYVPEVRNNVEAQARRLTEAAFPNDDFLACIPGRGGTWEGADIQKNLRLFQIKQARLRVSYFMFARQEVLYGTSPAFLPWRKESRRVFMSRKEGQKIKPKMSEVEFFNGPDFRVVDLLKWYPLSCLNSDFQQEGCFENKMMDRFELARRNAAGEVYGYHELKDCLADTLKKDELDRFIERVEASNLLLTDAGGVGEASYRKDQDLPAQKILHTEIHTKIELPEACTDDEDPSQPIPVIIDIYNSGHIGCIKRNKYFHQQAPYVVGTYIMPQNQDEFYGQGLPHAIQYMQHEINSKSEQAMDSATLALNPIAFIDPAMIGNVTEFEVEPGAKWYVSPNGVKFAAIPDTTQVGYAAIAQLRGQMQEYSDRSPALPPQLMGKSRTATQSEFVANAFSVDVKAFQMQNEIQVLQPTMEQWQFLTDQNVEDRQLLLLFGSQFKKARQVLIKKSQMLGRYQYEWRASSITQNRAMLTRQILDLIKVWGTLPPQDKQLAKFRLDEAFRVLAREGMALPNVEALFGLPYDQSTDPEVELEMLKEGLEISVSAGDDTMTHVKRHDADMNSDELDDAQKETLAAHIAEHAKAEQEKQRAQQMAMMQQQMLMAQQQGAQGGGSVGSGNRTQMSPNASSGDMASGMRA